MKINRQRLKEIIYNLAGIISVFLGFLGIFLPLLPTTPFLLLASYLFLKSSKKNYEWLMNHKIFGKYLRNYKIYKAIPLKAKILSLSFLWLTILISAYLIDLWFVKLALLVIAIAVSIHILKIKTMARDLQ